MKILIVDDSSFMINVLTGMLEGTEFEVVATAQEFQDAIEKFKQLQPDIVLLDIIMPGISGTELLAKFLELAPGAKVIVVSSLGTEDKVIECLKGGAKNFIQKPFEQKDLLRQLRNLKPPGEIIPEKQPKAAVSIPVISLGMKFFGEYLLEKGIISKEQLLTAIEFQKRFNIPLEKIAQDEGYLKLEDLIKVRTFQIKDLDKDVGEIMLELGFLNKDTLDKLKKEQKGKHIYIGDALVKIGAIDPFTLEKELKDYKQQQDQEEGEITKGLDKFKNRIIVMVFIDYTIKIFQKIIGENIKVKVCLPQTSIFSLRDYTLEQEIMGKVNLSFLLNIKQEGALKVSSAMFNQEIKTMSPEAEDALREFFNIIIGNTCTKLSNINLTFDVKPPVLYDNKTKNQYLLKEHEDLTFVSLISTFGEFDLLVKTIKN